jgi:thiol-disulfide isomerase/thioredoxin
MKKIKFILVIILILEYSLYSNNAWGKDKNKLKEIVGNFAGIYLNKEAKDGEFKDINGGKSYKLSDFKGKVIFLNFWATWCPPCRKELPDIQNLYKKYKDNKGFVILAVSLKENPVRIKLFKEKNNYEIPFFYDEIGLLGQTYGVMAIPTTFIIDKNFKIIAKFIGARNWNKEEFNSLLELLLK